jgi:hypothetical protein
MATADAADNLMLSGTVLFCPDCADERIFVVPDCGDGPSGPAGDPAVADPVGPCDYCCTACGAAVSVLAEPGTAQPTGSSRVA